MVSLAFKRLCAAALSVCLFLPGLAFAQGQSKEKRPVVGAKDQTITFPRKIVLIASPKDEHHGPGTHDYPATVATIKEALEASNVADKVAIEVVVSGWPEDPTILEDADAIFLYSPGADRNPADHPFLQEDRLKILEKQMSRGCGLMMLHWSLFVPIKYEKQFTNWIGGFFDYERGDDPRGWHSRIAFSKAKILPDSKHPISKGVPPFEHRDEYYYNIRFRKQDKRITPIVKVKLPEVNEPQIVAWAVERADGGRGFAFTGGHFQKSWNDEAYRTLMLNALCWTAKVPVPAGGVHKQLAFDDQWTPKPHLGKEDLPKEKEADWVDGRIRESDVGSFYTASIVVPDLGAAPDAPKDNRKGPSNPRMVTKALAIKVGEEAREPSAAVLFDKETMTLRCGWTGKFVNFSDRRFGLLEKPTVGGSPLFTNVENGWSVGDEGEMAPVEWIGLYPRGTDTILSYEVSGRKVAELNGLESSDSLVAFTRTFEVAAGADPIVVTIGKLEGASPSKSSEGIVALRTPDGKSLLAAQASSTDGTRLAADDDRLTLTFPASDKAIQTRVLLAAPEGGSEAGFLQLVGAAGPVKKLSDLIEAPRIRWGEPLVTQGKLGEPIEGSAFAVDTITIPYENPHKALFFIGGFDFASDGTCYVGTAHGDVWKVTGIDEDLDEITWQRFATGLYEPLGLKVRDDEIFVLGRDQITRLHDTNNDGEADFYENFNDDLTDSGQAHAYAMCLETDSQGNFYFIKSGAPETIHGGTLLKVSADGKELQVYATGYRHANGLGIGPDDTITSADNEGNWVPVTRIDIVEQGEFCGHVPTAHVDPEPADYGLPLCWLPRVVDNSAGGQAWVPEGHWGPLSGSLIHLSYGRCTANLVLKEQVDGVWQGGAVRLPMQRFLSGACRGRFRTTGDGADGHLYVSGINGWSTEADADGSLERVRYIGGPMLVPTGVSIRNDGIELAFGEPLDERLATDPSRYAVNAWNYRWSKDYGSADYSVADPTKEGRDSLKVTGARLSADGKRVVLNVEGLQPVMQLRVQAGLRTAAGARLPVDYYGTIHRIPSASGDHEQTGGR